MACSIGSGPVQQQPGGLDRITGDGDRVGPLEPLAPVAHVAHSGDPATRVVNLDLEGHATGADLRAVLDRVADVGDERRCLGVDLAPL